MPVSRQQALTDAASALGGSALRDRVKVTQGPAEATGPQAKLFKNPFKTGDYRFPSNLSTSNYESLHHVTFYINVQEKSSYNVKEEIDPNAMSSANQNRFADTQLGIGQISGSTQAVNSVIGTAVAAGALGAGGAVYGAKLGVFGAGAGALLGGGLGTAIVKSIDLSRKTKRLKSSISLYMPDTVQATMGHGYQGISMTNALGLVGAIGQGASGGVGSSVGEYFKNLGSSGNLRDLQGSGMGSLAELAGSAAAASGTFGDGIKEAILFSAGLAQNPQVEILYQQTEHRNFTFTFKMIPRSPEEAQVIRDIIKQFKFYAAPELLPGSTGRFFIPPAEFDIKFFYNGKPNDNINKISTCVLTRIDVNYASAGQWTTFDDGMPVETTLQLEFQELEIMHKKRIEDGY